MKKILHIGPFILFIGLWQLPVSAQELANNRNPLFDLSLSPAKNDRINPSKNPVINPKTNWNINPSFNKDINPTENQLINPRQNREINPLENVVLNPMRFRGLHPKSETWKGFYMFDNNDNIAGYITKPSKEVLICFDIEGKWTCYYVLTPEGTYNHFEIDGSWTGNYLCSDNIGGYNLFDKEGVWTGKHIK
jgi:hypothetical protein